MQTDIRPIPRPDLQAILHPRSIVVAGVTSRARGPERSAANSVVTNNFVAAIREQGFDGRLYAVNPKLSEFMGLPCYPSIKDVPEDQIDYVISGVPAAAALDLIEACGAKGVRLVSFFTAGFSETGDADRAGLEQRIVARARQLGIRVIGPNCMGLYSPRAKVAFASGFPKEPGWVSFLSQSGGNATEFTRAASARGLRFANVLSYGNAVDLTEADLFEMAGSDPDTSVVAGYIEGVRDGPRFAHALRAAGLHKPAVILKGGRTEAGGRATRSHTGSLAGSARVFDALCRQAAATVVTNMDDLTDACVAFSFLGEVAGPNIAVVGGGGGPSVLAADEVASAGLRMPSLSPATQQALWEFTPVQGTSVRNPVDTSVAFDLALLSRTLEVVASDPGIDVVLYSTGFWNPSDAPRAGAAERYVTRMTEMANGVSQKSGKPFALVFRPPMSLPEFDSILRLQQAAGDERIATFPSIARAARAIAAVIERKRLLTDR